MWCFLPVWNTAQLYVLQTYWTAYKESTIAISAWLLLKCLLFHSGGGWYKSCIYVSYTEAFRLLGSNKSSDGTTYNEIYDTEY